MPPKVKITKEEITAAALELLRQRGMEAINARAVAKELGCSTQPIFSNYSTMTELFADVLAAAYTEYSQWTGQQMKMGRYPPYKASGMAYISLPDSSRSCSGCCLCGTGERKHRRQRTILPAALLPC